MRPGVPWPAWAYWARCSRAASSARRPVRRATARGGGSARSTSTRASSRCTASCPSPRPPPRGRRDGLIPASILTQASVVAGRRAAARRRLRTSRDPRKPARRGRDNGAMSTPTDRRTAGAVGHPADRRLVPPRQLPRRGPAVGGPAGRPRRVLLRVDLHAITVEHDPATLRRAHPLAAAQLLALRASTRTGRTLFVQSPRPRARPAAWVLGCITGFGEAEPDDPVQGQVGPRRAPTASASGCSPTRS